MADSSRSTEPPSEHDDERAEPFMVSTIEQIKALTHPLRQRILECFALKARTTKQVADELGEKPTRLYHHVSALERAGLIRLVETRPKRGTTEKYFAAVAKRFEIDPRTFSAEGGRLSIAAPSVAVLEGLFENTRAELATLIEREEVDTLAAQALFTRIEVRGDRATIVAARERIEALVRALHEDSRDGVEDSEVHRLILGWYPLRRQEFPST